MNIFNRVVVIALLIVLIVAGLVIASSPEALLAFLQYWTAGAVVTPKDRIASGIIGAVLVIVSAAVLFIELRPQRRKTVLVTRMSDGTAALELQSIAQRIRQQVEALPGVRQASPNVLGRDRRVDVRLLVQTTTEVDVPSKAAEISDVVRDTVGKMGVTLGKQKINLRYDGGANKATQRA